MGQTRRRHFCAGLFASSKWGESLTTTWPILKHQQQHTSSLFQRFHSMKFLHSSLSERTILNWIHNCQHSSCDLERQELLETYSIEMESSSLGRESALKWSVKHLGMKKGHNAIQNSLHHQPQLFSEEKLLLLVLGTNATVCQTPTARASLQRN